MDVGEFEPRGPESPYGVAEDGCPAVLMLDLRGHNGTCVAFPYDQLRTIAFDPVEGVRLEFQEHRVRLCGRNLRRLYDLLVVKRVTFVQEGDLDVLPESSTFVDGIHVERMDDLV